MKKHLILLALILLVVTSFSVAFYLFYEIKEHSSDFVEKKKELKHLQVKTSKLEKMKNQEELESFLEKSHSLFVDPRKPIDTVLFLEEVAEENDLSIKIETERRGDANPWPYFVFDIDTMGSFEGTLTFLEEIQSREWVASVERLSMERKEDGISAQTILKTYFLQE